MGLTEKLAYYLNLENEEIKKVNSTFEKIKNLKQETAKKMGMTIVEYNIYLDDACKANVSKPIATTVVEKSEVISHWDYVANGYKPMSKWKWKNKK